MKYYIYYVNQTNIEIKTKKIDLKPNLKWRDYEAKFMTNKNLIECWRLTETYMQYASIEEPRI